LTEAGVPAFQVSRRTYLRLAERDGPDGLAAVVRLSSLNLADITPGPAARLLVLDSFELAGNVGSLIRCADAVGASAVILTEQHVRINHPLVMKASMGTAFSVPLCSSDAETALTWLRGQGFWVLGADPPATTSYRDADYRARTAVVLGSERCGLSRFWKQASDQLVSIPMLGDADSLNVGHAGALILYEALHRQQAPQPSSSPSVPANAATEATL
jgi:TrmH family RNA methyltransferase